MAELSYFITDIIFICVNILSGLFIYHAYTHFSKGPFKNITKWLLLNIILIIVVHLAVAIKDLGIVTLLKHEEFFSERGLLILSSVGFIYLGYLMHKFAKTYGFAKR